MPLTRRALSGQALAALATAGLAQLLWSRDVVAGAVRPALGAWLTDLAEMTRALRGRQLGEREFQRLLDDLCERVDPADLHAAVDLDALMARAALPDTGARSVDVDLAALAGAPRLGFGQRVFACRRGRAIVPHGHDDLCTAFIVLSGRWRGRHYDRLETHADHYVIRPTSDREFAPGDHSTVSDHRDNVHWFQAETDRAFVFNVHVACHGRGGGSRVYLDPDGERLPGGAIRAAKLDKLACVARYGG
ncbi:hypothetical protein [Nannocystis punicea]|uniref:Uncharacterized protein n=1 Tax=Nannocystis punicea TaxID=2995304 RepID=A0ABY7GU56_9BACT|nr:hypothetical protein [Nannocystis poenicansa]WAS90483.1 hypothetical protein O0S08_30210 [Nannocystis poenicansa]